MASIGDVLRVTACGNLLGETFCNVFYYIVAIWTGNVTVEDVKSQFLAEVIDILRAVQVDNLTWTNCNVENMMDDDEFWEAVFARPGEAVDNARPAFVAAGVQLLRTKKNTRHGAKRICGMGDANFTDGEFTPTAPFILAIEDACKASLEQDDLAGNAFEVNPVIVGTDLVTGLPDPTITNPIKNAALRRVTTQNSRKGYTA